MDLSTGYDVSELYPAAVRAARPLVGSDAAQDIAQEAMLRLLSGPQPQQPAAWLTRVARNLSIDELRRRKRSTLVAETPEMTSHTADVAELMTVRDAVGKLPEKYRMVLWLKHVEGRTAKDIASMLGATQSSVELTLFRARKALREAYEPRERGVMSVMVLPFIALARWLYQHRPVNASLPAVAQSAATWVVVAGVGVASVAAVVANQHPTARPTKTAAPAPSAVASAAGAPAPKPVTALGGYSLAAHQVTSSVLPLDQALLAADKILSGTLVRHGGIKSAPVMIVDTREALFGAVPIDRVRVRVTPEMASKLRDGEPLVFAVEGAWPARALAALKIAPDGSLAYLDGTKTNLTLDGLRGIIARLHPAKGSSAKDDSQAKPSDKETSASVSVSLTLPDLSALLPQR